MWFSFHKVLNLTVISIVFELESIILLIMGRTLVQIRSQKCAVTKMHKCLVGVYLDELELISSSDKRLQSS